MGRMVTETRCVDGRTVAMTYDYDKLGRLRSVGYPDGEVVEYLYDPAGRLREMPGTGRVRIQRFRRCDARVIWQPHGS